MLAGGPHGYSYFTGYLLAGLKGEADRDGDTIVTMSELSAFLLSSATNWDHTPNWGVLREHDSGEFWFRVPSSSDAPIDLESTRDISLSVPPDSPWIFKSQLAGENGRPKTLTHQQGPIDSLSRIAEIGKEREAALYEMGVYHYSQIADWNDDNILWLVDNVPSFRNLKKKILKNAIQCLRDRQPAPGASIPRELAKQCGALKNSNR
ncbi:MAG: hypothetical protein OEU92_13055 [Alphaproteobacteria bacterium]|nr:hypothetical protein [Alphaproteobacteria bacterium]